MVERDSDRKRIGLIGFAYDTPSLNLQQENAGYAPKYFDWVRGAYDLDTVVYLEQTINEPKLDNAKHRIGMLIEPYELRPNHYQWAMDHKDEFEMILTHSKSMIQTYGSPFRFYPLGGSFLNKWRMRKKTKLVSIIPGYKTELSGHVIRHIVAKRIADVADVFDYGTLPTKGPALSPYMFSVVIENSRSDFWFTEKIIDAMSQGTVPVYWGCPSIGNFFDDRGIIPFKTVEDANYIVRHLDSRLYDTMKRYARENKHLALRYASLENWLSSEYPGVFK